jgi:pimeloyl-ACP methyl ester carboxylesterase/N-acetylglutamate synthase-like GNAT family acetyltransferase
MPTVRANGLDIHYEDTGGTGAPVVLIHGHSVDLRMWPAQALALRAAGFRVIRYDVRGHGESSAPAGGYTWPVYAADLGALLDVLALPPVHLAGFSMGGGIALQYTLDHPERVLSLTLIDATVPGYAYSDEFTDTIEQLVASVRAEGWRRSAERLWLPHPMFNGIRRRPAAFQILRELVLDFPARDYLVDPPEPEPPEAVDRLGELRRPVLVMVGADDLLDFLLCARLVALNAPRARLEVIADAGHVTPLERPDEVNRLLLEFLADPEAATEEPAPALAIRPADERDVHALARLNGSYSTRRLLRLERRGRAPEHIFDFTIVEREGEPFRLNVRDPGWWRGWLAGGGEALLATLEETVVGAAALREPEGGPALLLADLRVLPEARGSGVGRSLIDAAMGLARERGLLGLRYDLPSDNVDGIEFLLRCGFRISGFDDALYGAAPEEAADAVTLFLTRSVLPAPSP